MKKLYGVMMLVALILVIGTAGACEQDTISIGQAVGQALIAVVIGAAGFCGMKHEENKR